MQEYLRKIYSQDKESYYKLLASDLKKGKKRFIITVNPETLMLSEKDDELKSILDNDSNSFVPDGIAVVKSARKTGVDIKERITGVDITDYLLTIANKEKYSVYFFGAKEEVLESLLVKIANEYPNIKVAGYSNGYVKNRDNVMKDIIKKSPDICIVALGIPYQEKIIAKYFPKAKKGIYIGVGGSLDVLSGTKKRAPKLFIKLNMEWLYRLIKEPSRIKRFWNYNVKFIFKIKKQ